MRLMEITVGYDSKAGVDSLIFIIKNTSIPAKTDTQFKSSWIYAILILFEIWEIAAKRLAQLSLTLTSKMNRRVLKLSTIQSTNKYQTTQNNSQEIQLFHQ